VTRNRGQLASRFPSDRGDTAEPGGNPAPAIADNCSMKPESLAGSCLRRTASIDTHDRNGPPVDVLRVASDAYGFRREGWCFVRSHPIQDLTAGDAWKQLPRGRLLAVTPRSTVNSTRLVEFNDEDLAPAIAQLAKSKPALELVSQAHAYEQFLRFDRSAAREWGIFFSTMKLIVEE
jgi:hypothetical protein